MQSSAEGDLIVAKLEDGDDLFAKIDELAALHGVGSGMVLWAIGMLRDLELGYFDGSVYERTPVPGPLELLALHGTYAFRGEPRLHVHVAGAGPDLRVVGGHLFRATVNVLNELCVRRLPATRLGRARNPRSGLNELTVEAIPEGPGVTSRAARTPAPPSSSS